MDGGEARRATPPPRHNREWSAELERTVALLAADLDSPAPMPSRVERWRRVLFPSYGARANAADALVTLAEAARARRETTAVFGRSS